jgi:hypothetical protein
MPPPWQEWLDLSPALCGLCGVLIAHVSCVRATNPACARMPEQASLPCACDDCVGSVPVPLSKPVMIALPFATALLLLALFFFRAVIGTALVAVYAVIGLAAVAFAIRPVFGRGLLRDAPAATVAAALAVAGTVVTAWLVTGQWALANIMAGSMCVLVVSLCKAPSFKLVSLVLAIMSLYDVFFVFFSERIFGENIMVQVSTVASRNPISIFTEALHLSMSPVRRLPLPGKIVFPSTLAGSPDGAFTMLGLGDIMLPSILLCYLRDCDIALCSSQSVPLSYFYYLRALLAYAVAITTCFLANAASESAQPGLMYIVPALLIPTLILARARREFQFIWHGSQRLLDTDSTLAERLPLTRRSQGGAEEHSSCL